MLILESKAFSEVPTFSMVDEFCSLVGMSCIHRVCSTVYPFHTLQVVGFAQTLDQWSKCINKEQGNCDTVHNAGWVSMEHRGGGGAGWQGGVGLPHPSGPPGKHPVPTTASPALVSKHPGKKACLAVCPPLVSQPRRLPALHCSWSISALWINRPGTMIISQKIGELFFLN